jgi:hypothetical protein
MKKFVISTFLTGYLAVLFTLTLTGCNEQSVKKADDNIRTAQLAVMTACKYEPTAATIAAIFTANQSASMAQIASMLCAAVNGTSPTPTYSLRSTGDDQATVYGAGPMFVTVNGKKIPVEGTFVETGK